MAFPPHWEKLIAGKSRVSASDMNEIAATVQGLARSAPANSMVTPTGIITRPTSGVGAAIPGTADNPEVMLPAVFENENAQADTWDKADQDAGEDGVEVRMVMRIVYEDGGDELLYAMYRTFTFDSTGLLKTISAETRVTIADPELCVT